jgi:DNA-directed RNA polymerase specialized sigma24 family protein
LRNGESCFRDAAGRRSGVRHDALERRPHGARPVAGRASGIGKAFVALDWWPLYAFVRREGHRPEDAKDLTQEFFARLLERRDFDAVRREKGRLRSYLLVALKHFLANERHRASALKRGHGQQLISLDEILAHQRSELEPADTLSADQIYERRWALTVLE